MGSSPDINYPAQPSYGEGMADALKSLNISPLVES